MLLVSWTFDKVIKGFKNAENLRSVGQKATKVQAIKLWEWFDPGRSRMRADRFKRGLGWAADFFLRPSNYVVTFDPFNLQILYWQN